LSESTFIEIGGRRLEYRTYMPRIVSDPRTIIMLHEGLGSVALWKQFPQQVADTVGMRVVAYSRFGYGRSDAPPTYGVLELQEREALDVLPAFLRALQIERPILFGHSDGASISLIYAGHAPTDVSALILMAPHVFVEDICITNIAAARRAYLETNLREKLAPYHDDPDRAFWLWNTIWLDPSFRTWNIDSYLPSIACPTLAIQGYDDEYGTMEQLDRIAREVRTVTLLKLKHCRHSPHRDQPESVLAALRQFLAV
jgi:pimeloyl-ACP methyl ester carboxylesterase